MKKNWAWFFLALAASVLGLGIAISPLRTQLVFGYDQARDAFEAYSIWHGHHLKILGPATDIPGVSHGVLWYYFLAVIIFLGQTPQSSALIFLLILFLSVPLVGFVTAKLFKNPPVTALTVSFYALAPLFQVFTRWLSNPSLAIIVSPLLLFSFWQYLQKPKTSNAFFSGLFLGLLIQSQFAYAFLLVLLPIYLWHFRPKTTFAHGIAFITAGLATTSTFLAAEIKFGGQATGSIVNFILHHDSNPAASSVLLTVFDRLFDMVSYTFLPGPKLIILIFFVVIFVALHKNKFKINHPPIIFLAIWLFGYIIFQGFSTAVSGSAHLFAAFIFPATALFAYIFYHFLKLYPKAVVILLLIFFSQILTQQQWIKAGYTPHSAQRGAFLSLEQSLVDYTYQEAHGKNFIINSITNPLYINTLWAYLYEFYGQPKYGYLPFWGGMDQAGRLGNLAQKPFGEPLRYLIIEDTNIIPDFYREKMIYAEDKVSDVIEEKSFGKLRVQKRIFHPDKGLIPVPKLLQQVSPNLRE